MICTPGKSELCVLSLGVEPSLKISFSRKEKENNFQFCLVCMCSLLWYYFVITDSYFNSKVVLPLEDCQVC